MVHTLNAPSSNQGQPAHSQYNIECTWSRGVLSCKSGNETRTARGVGAECEGSGRRVWL